MLPTPLIHPTHSTKYLGSSYSLPGFLLGSRDTIPALGEFAVYQDIHPGSEGSYHIVGRAQGLETSTADWWDGAALMLRVLVYWDGDGRRSVCRKTAE